MNVWPNEDCENFLISIFPSFSDKSQTTGQDWNFKAPINQHGLHHEIQNAVKMLFLCQTNLESDKQMSDTIGNTKLAG